MTGLWLRARISALLLFGGAGALMVAWRHAVPVPQVGAEPWTPTRSEQEPVSQTELRRRHPHEPAGYIPFAEHDGGSMPSYPKSATSLRGIWYSHPVGNPRLTIQHDRLAPESPDGVMCTEYPAGFPAGNSPVNWGGWDTAGSGPAGQKSEIYLSIWLKIVGPGFENQGAGTKAGFIGVGRDVTQAQNEAFFWLDNGTGRSRVMSSFPVLFKQQGTVQPRGDGSRNLVQNANRRPIMTAGRWHHWEAVMELNTLGRANGVFRMWIDGNLTHNYSDVTYIWPGSTNGFNNWKWGAIWGGEGGPRRTRFDRILIDHVYLSGVPLRPDETQPAR